jgi:hypothetical protein
LSFCLLPLTTAAAAAPAPRCFPPSSLLASAPRWLAAGQLEDRTKPILFSMARLDKVKNLTGLVSWFAGNQRLRELVNLVIVGE